MAVLLGAILAGTLVFARKPLLSGGALGKTVFGLAAFLLMALVFLLAIERIEGMGENTQ